MKKIISHNTFSYLPVRQWWLRPFAWMARCQDLLDMGADGYDIRVRFRDGEAVFAHGLIEYDDSVSLWLKHIRTATKGKPVRVLLETTPFMSRRQRAEQKALFWVFCDRISDLYRNVTFYGGWPRDEWRCKVYDFGTKEPDVTEMHGSVSGNKLNCLRLKSWARKHNHEIIENAKTEYVMIDFVEYQ